MTDKKLVCSNCSAEYEYNQETQYQYDCPECHEKATLEKRDHEEDEGGDLKSWSNNEGEEIVEDVIECLYDLAGMSEVTNHTQNVLVETSKSIEERAQEKEPITDLTPGEMNPDDADQADSMTYQGGQEMNIDTSSSADVQDVSGDSGIINDPSVEDLEVGRWYWVDLDNQIEPKRPHYCENWAGEIVFICPTHSGGITVSDVDAVKPIPQSPWE